MQETSATTSTPITMPPIPLVSGNVATDSDGIAQDVAAVTLHIAGHDNTLQVIELEYRFGGWWTPVRR